MKVLFRIQNKNGLELYAWFTNKKIHIERIVFVSVCVLRQKSSTSLPTSETR